MHVIVKQVIIPDQPRTGITVEREVFAELKKRQVRALRAARRERGLAWVRRWRSSVARFGVRRPGKQAAAARRSVRGAMRS